MGKGSVLIIGGSGIIGSEASREAVEQGYSVTSVALQNDPALPPDVSQVEGNIRDARFEEIAGALNRKTWDMVFNVVSFSRSDIQRTFELFGQTAQHIALLSTTLVYDRTQPTTAPIKSGHPLAKKGTMGGYVDEKLDMEEGCRESDTNQWTLLRPYHVLGKKSALGCLPFHNRDPRLLQRMRRQEPLELCEGGACALNTVHPKDIARTVLAIIGKATAFRKAYNLVNPSIVTGEEYYREIGECIGVQRVIKSIPVREVWERQQGWELTTLPHVYDTSDLEADIGFVPSISFKESIRDALDGIDETNTAIPPVHERMTKLPRPQRIEWLMEMR